jgi:hypothetical protein
MPLSFFLVMFVLPVAIICCAIVLAHASKRPEG